VLIFYDRTIIDLEGQSISSFLLYPWKYKISSETCALALSLQILAVPQALLVCREADVPIAEQGTTGVGCPLH